MAGGIDIGSDVAGSGVFYELAVSVQAGPDDAWSIHL